MKKQIIAAIGREHGSGGHYIADMVARELGIKRYHDTWMLCASIILPFINTFLNVVGFFHPHHLFCMG